MRLIASERVYHVTVLAVISLFVAPVTVAFSSLLLFLFYEPLAPSLNFLCDDATRCFEELVEEVVLHQIADKVLFA